MCRCKECGFCTDTAQPCVSSHINDADSAKCEPFCLQRGQSLEFVCSFCSCRGCDVCASYTEDPGKRVQIHSTDCPIGVELMVVSERNFRKGWHYDAKLRVGDWQPNALITVDFAQHHESVEIDPAQIKAAALKWDKKASFQIELGSYPDEIGGASFGFTILKGRFDNNEGPTVVCTQRTSGATRSASSAPASA